MGPDPNQQNVYLIEETRKQINRLMEEVARLADMDLAPPDFYGEFLKRILTALTAPAGAIWTRTAQGNLQLQYQINMRQVGLDQSETGKQSHDELLRQLVLRPQPIHLPPQSSAGQPEGDRPAPGNPTNYLVLLVPIVAENQVVGLIEVWQNPDRHPQAIKGFLQFMQTMADMAARYTRNHMLRQMVGQQQVWTQMEAFARQVHASLHTTEVAYLVANEGRRLVDCDRVSVGVRYGRRVKVEAVSGADVVEKRSNLVQLMRKLFERVLRWGEKLVYTGTKDEGLPPDVLKALDDYLAESNSKLLVVQPLRDERESESKKPPRSALIMECFEPAAAPEQLMARLDVVGRHATSALYNAVEHRRIPFRFIWMPIAKIQEGLGGKARAIGYTILAAFIVVMFLMLVPPWILPLPGQTLKMEATGQLLPVNRYYIFAPQEGKVLQVEVNPGQRFDQRHALIKMYSQKLHEDIIRLEGDKEIAWKRKVSMEDLLKKTPEDQKPRIEADRAREEINWQKAGLQLEKLREITNAHPSNPGEFYVIAPRFPSPDPKLRRVTPDQPQLWTVLNDDFKEKLTNNRVTPSDPLLRLGDKEGPWEVELKIPQKHIGQVKAAFERVKKDGKYPDLDVDLLVRIDPTQTFKGKLAWGKIGGQAEPNRENEQDSEPIVLAYVRIDGDDIPEEYRLPSDKYKYLLVTGTEVYAKIRCGEHQLGYSLFYGVWEFLREKIIFPYF
jgi:hypothetical protein